MFTILKKEGTVCPEDLETLQNEIEQYLVEVVTQRWRLERELDALNNVSPDTSSQPVPITTIDGSTNTKATLSSSQPTSCLPGGKLRNSIKLGQVDLQTENASDGFRNSIFQSNNNGANGTSSGTNSNETDSISSEGSLNSNLTGSTIITANLTDPMSLHQSATGIPTGCKRSSKNSSDDRPSKRFRQNSSNSLQSTDSFPKRTPHSKHRSKIVPSKFRNSIEESRPNKKQIFKNETPDKLWPFVEQFCATPTEDQMKDLEELLKAMDNDREYYKIPVSPKKEASNPSSSVKDEVTNNHKGSRKSKTRHEEESSLGALTQRLACSFMEEVEYNGSELSKSSGEASPPSNKKRKTKNRKSIDETNAKNLEERIRQQLEDYSILSQQDNIPYTSEEDEILRELLVHQHELLSVQTQNRQSMQILLKRARRHSELERERSNLREANADVIAAYQRLIQAKQRKRNPTKKEKDAAWRALKTHESIFKKCDELYMTGLDRNNI